MIRRSSRRQLPLPLTAGALTLTLVAVLQGGALAGSITPVDAEAPGQGLEAQPDGIPMETMPLEVGSSLRDAPPVLSGWPQMMGTNPSFPPVGVLLTDLDGDGDLEVLAGSTDNLFYAWDHTGALLSGFPVNLGGQIQSKAASADLDGDGDLEILVAVKTGQLHALHHDGAPVTGWPQATGFTYGLLSPSIYDLDGDEVPEVLLGGGGSVRVWSGDGVPRSGWPRTVPGNITGTLAIGDVTGDEVPEIFAVSTSGDLNALAPDGSVVPGWPATFGLSSSWAAPSIGDLDHDGVNEVCVVGYTFGVSSAIHAFRGDGTAMPGFPVSHPSIQTYSCPVLGDVDGDDDLEIFNAGKIDGPSFYAFDHLGSVLPGWPVTADPNMEGSAIVVDFDGIPGMEIAVGDNNGPGEILGYNADGSIATDFPVSKPGISGPNSPEVGDVDGDGDLDMAMTMWNGAVVVWDWPRSYEESAIEWGALFHDDWNTNQHGFVVPNPDPVAAPLSDGHLGLRIGSPYPNPLRNRATSVPFELPVAESIRVTLHDASGRVIREILNAPMSEGEHEILWDGRDVFGRHVPGGNYFLRFEGSSSRRSSATITVLR